MASAILSGDRLTPISGRDAILCEDRRISYGELADLVSRTGAALRAEGCRAGERVILRMRDTEYLVASVLGAMSASFVPVILSPRVTEDDVRSVADETGSVVLVEDDEIGVSAAPAKRLSASDLAAVLRSGALGEVSNGVEPSREAFWLYSSGTTGRMKGVIHGHHDLAPVLAYHRDSLGVGPGTRTFCTSRISFAYAMSNGFLAPLALGATVVLHADWPTPESTLSTAERFEPQVVFSVPSMYRAWLEGPAERLAAVRTVDRFVSAGEALPTPIAERWLDAVGRPILDCYGCSETCFLVFASPADRPKVGSVGFPCAGVETQLRDEEGRPVEPGKAGRFFVRHPFVALGYGPATNAGAQARFRDGWFATGDVFRCDEDGYWHHYGREDDWLKIAGQWVSLRGVEEAAAACGAVAQAVGVTAHDRNGFLRVALFVVPERPGEAASAVDHVRAFLEDRLPAFKRPKWIRSIDDLPRTTTGKVRKADLRRIIEEEMP